MNFDVGLYWHLQTCKLGMTIKTAQLYMLISVWMTVTFTQSTVTVVWDIKNSIFSEMSRSIWLKFSMLLHPVGLLKLMLNLLCTSNIQGIKLCWRDFIKSMFNVVLCQDTGYQICFKLGMMQNTTEPLSLLPVWMTFLSTQGHRVTGNLELMH